MVSQLLLLCVTKCDSKCSSLKQLFYFAMDPVGHFGHDIAGNALFLL